ncbi:MAG TPA: hypothetical protein VIW68_15240 [Candidatus Sulfotelmatobacter sp.]
MKKFAIVGLLALGFFLGGCGTTRTPTTEAGGHWEVIFAAGNPPVNETLFNFETTFTVSGSGALIVTNVNFLTTGPCFAVSGVGDRVAGKWSVTSAPSDPIATANVTYTVQGGGNLLTLTGTATGSTNTVTDVTNWSAVTGTWTLTGNSNCTGSGASPGGTFTMCPNGTTCTIT